MNESTGTDIIDESSERLASNAVPVNTTKEQMLENLEWLLQSEEAIFADEAENDRRERQSDLLLWLMQLEPRLSPYPEPQTA